MYALQAISLIYHLLSKEELMHDDRTQLLIGANYAGQAINITRTTLPHALSYTLTSKYGYPHGHAVALAFPYFFKYNRFPGECHPVSFSPGRRLPDGGGSWILFFCGTAVFFPGKVWYHGASSGIGGENRREPGGQEQKESGKRECD